MSTATIGVYKDAKEVAYDAPTQVIEVSFTGTPGQASAIPGAVGEVLRCRIIADAACRFGYGAGAAAAGQLMGAYGAEYFGIKAGTVMEFVEA